MKKKIKNILKVSLFSIYENYKKKRNYKICIKNRDQLINLYFKTSKNKKLQIGCGSNLLKGWLNTDLNYSKEIAFLDAGDVFSFNSNTYDFIYSEHLFEHLKVAQQLNMLNESFRVLKKGGVMRIAMPSLDFLFNLYSNSDNYKNKNYVDWAVKNVVNLKIVNELVDDKSQHYKYVINNFFKAWGHQILHNYTSIESLALQCGFSNVKECRIGESEYVSLQGIEKHGTIIPAHINEIETFVVELTK
ncbi:putative SAM-dependent methyltransferase [Lutibacter sp. Hel_I_33_5]|uniref:class I SAM-dependent methyltransferase n=1 Tax=Lutibacter sp. Hel_I_33_5 TaxID=1566289 RepID=UPI0011A5291E|nr:methyltransferase domain-containing protein [Lutibacter sp. Hel_I_33_5]TVZ54854.1 putative SAM-dependent methyltransferase [Lutibacter sp. Hel_I_33_5]